MSPTIPMGAEIVLRPVQAMKLRVGDVITFRRPGQLDQLVTHRIVRIENARGGRRFVTKGDANAVPDSWRIPARGTGWREVFAVPYVGYLMQGFRAPYVRFGIVALLAIALTTLVLRRIWANPEA
jgi:signal peptidase